MGQTTLNYTGQRLDSTGLLYYHARYYDPSLGKFLSPDSIVPGASFGAGGALGTVGQEQNSRLTVDFHESGFVSSVQGENQQILRKGFWFQLSGEDKQQATEPWGPSNPQAMNRFSYGLSNPLKYVDPTGHNGSIINNSSYPIIVVGNDTKTNTEVVRILPPGMSSSQIGISDADFWRPMDADPEEWMKIGDLNLIVENSLEDPYGIHYNVVGAWPSTWAKWGERISISMDYVTCKSRTECHDNGFWFFQRNLPYDQMYAGGTDWDKFVNSTEYDKWSNYNLEQRCSRGRIC